MTCLNSVGEDKVPLAHRETKAEVDERIRRLARVILSSFYALLTPKRLKEFRDLFWSLGSSIDEALNTAPPRWKKRPSGEDIKALEMQLKRFVAHDKEKLAAVEQMWAGISPVLKEFPRGILHVDHNLPAVSEAKGGPRELRSILDIMLRGYPGRPPDDEKQKLFQEALILKDKGWSYTQIAIKKIPAEYKENHQRATNRIKAGIIRLKKAVTKTS